MSERHWTELRDDALKIMVERHQRPKTVLKPKTVNQGKYFEAIDAAKAVVCTGPAGSGKTFVACGKAVEKLQAGAVSRIVLTRPLVECGEETGFLPGDLWEKIQDMMAPTIDALDEFLGSGELDSMRRDGRLQVIPLAKMRGRTLKGAFVILDEAQNATYKQLRMFLTRFGSNSKMVICGDHTQSDLPYQGSNSLWEVVERFRQNCHPKVRVVELTNADIVRDELVQWFEERLATEQHTPSLLTQPSDDWSVIPCPGCQVDVWYENWADEGDKLILCRSCLKYIELRDKAGRLDPEIVVPSKEEIMESYEGLDRRP